MLQQHPNLTYNWW